MEETSLLGSETDELIERALAEDLGPGDATTLSLVPENATAAADIVSRDEGVVSGVQVASEVFHQLDPKATLKIIASDGDPVKPGDVVLTVMGSARAILSGERTALNFLQRMSGIATLTARYVEETRGFPVQILDTRKTTPTLRILEKKAVHCGGGVNHRMGLYDRAMIKDNHLAFWGRTAGHSLLGAIRSARSRYPDLEVEVEVDRLEQLDELLDDPPEWLLLDNMTPEQVRLCVERCNGACRIEVSGGVTLDRVAEYAAAGPDAISVGALTHSARALDFSLELKT